MLFFTIVTFLCISNKTKGCFAASVLLVNVGYKCSCPANLLATSKVQCFLVNVAGKVNVALVYGPHHLSALENAYSIFS